ncbi:MAG TPA: TldD/PmbA family protein [Actinomycetota bacterium]
MADLRELVGVALASAGPGEQLEAFAEEGLHTEVSALRGEVEGMRFAESRGLGVRVIFEDRLGYAWAADPTEDEVRDVVRRARENAALAEPDEHQGLPEPGPIEPMPELFRPGSADITVDSKVRRALDLEAYTVSRDPRVTKVDLAQIGDSVGRQVVASTLGIDAEYTQTGAWVVVVTLAVDGDETQTGYSFRLARGLDELDQEPVADEAVDRAVRMLGATKPDTARLPVVLDPFAASSFLGVLAGALNAENVLKGRSLFADLVGQKVGADPFTLVDDGRRLDGPGACPFDGEGVASSRTELFTAGRLNGFLHNAYTARRAGNGQRSTGNAKRGGYRGAPGVGTSNFFLEAGPRSWSDLLEAADGGVLIQDVSGVHSGANPISGEFSVGATGLRITGGHLGEPLREMTIASTLPDMLTGITAVGSDFRFFSSVGTPSILIGEMTLAGV